MTFEQKRLDYIENVKKLLEAKKAEAKEMKAKLFELEREANKIFNDLDVFTSSYCTYYPFTKSPLQWQHSSYKKYKGEYSEDVENFSFNFFGLSNSYSHIELEHRKDLKRYKYTVKPYILPVADSIYGYYYFCGSYHNIINIDADKSKQVLALWELYNTCKNKSFKTKDEAIEYVNSIIKAVNAEIRKSDNYKKYYAIFGDCMDKLDEIREMERGK